MLLDLEVIAHGPAAAPSGADTRWPLPHRLDRNRAIALALLLDDDMLALS